MSNIDSSAININYPEAKVNNNSQGFRDNFAAIKNGLNTASNELTQIQTKGLLKAPLDGFLVANDMANTLISNASTLNFNHTTYETSGGISGSVVVNVSRADVQSMVIVGNVTMQIINWAPVGTYREFELTIILSGAAPANTTVAFPSQVTSGLDTIENYDSVTKTINFPANENALTFMLSSIDCGTNIEIRPINRSRKITQISDRTIPDRTGSQGDVAGDIAYDSTYLYVCIANYDGSTPIWYRKELLPF